VADEPVSRILRFAKTAPIEPITYGERTALLVTDVNPVNSARIADRGAFLLGSK
jgi:hypothetical protein